VTNRDTPPAGRHRHLSPVGPGAPADGDHTDPPCPPFATDPIGWFTWVDDALAAGRSLEPAAQPSAWTDAEGCEWRVLASTDGPEVRPSFGSAFMIERGMPMISALLVSPTRMLVELTWRDGREVVEAAHGAVACRDLGLAMLTGTELPHEAITRLGPDTWERAGERWRERSDAAAAGPQSPDTGTGDPQPRASWPLSAR
jgi:hypothetical protein